MLLDRLKTEQEKQAFVELAYRVAKADGCVSLTDMTLIDLFGQELQQPECPQADSARSVSELCEIFTEPLSREIIYSNLLSMVYAEPYPDSWQKQVLEQIRKAMGVSQEEESRQRNWIKLIKGTYFPTYCYD